MTEPRIRRIAIETRSKDGNHGRIGPKETRRSERGERRPLFQGRAEQENNILTFSNRAALDMPPEVYLKVVNEVLRGTRSPVYREKTLIEHVEKVELRLPQVDSLVLIKVDGEFVGLGSDMGTTTTTTKPPTKETETQDTSVPIGSAIELPRTLKQETQNTAGAHQTFAEMD